MNFSRIISRCLFNRYRERPYCVLMVATIYVITWIHFLGLQTSFVSRARLSIKIATARLNPLLGRSSKTQPNVTILAISGRNLPTRHFHKECNLSFHCTLTSYTSEQNISQFSAVQTLFGGVGLRILSNVWESQTLERDPKQIWIATSMESSPNSANYAGVENSVLRHLFNWTFFPSERATFENDYFHVNPRKIPLSFNDVIKEYRSVNKSRDFCWLVSNCEMLWTDRFKLGASIIRHLPGSIHMWGSAASSCLGGYGLKNLVNHGTSKGSDWQVTVRSCKFYFAFENSNCSNYITEKFSGALQNFAIPIVNGWPSSYQRILPGGYIITSDFKNSEDLGRYLGYLLKNETAFFEYHRWRTQKQLGASSENCRMCEKISQVARDFGTEASSNDVIRDLVKEFRTLQQCNPHVAGE